MDITTLVHQLKLADESSLESLPQDPGVRKELAALLSNLRQRFENPADTIMRFLFQVIGSQQWLEAEKNHSTTQG